MGRWERNTQESRCNICTGNAISYLNLYFLGWENVTGETTALRNSPNVSEFALIVLFLLPSLEMLAAAKDMLNFLTLTYCSVCFACIHITKCACNNFWNNFVVLKSLFAFLIQYVKSTFSLPTLTLSYPQIYQLTDEALIQIPCAGTEAWQLLWEEFNIYREEDFKRMKENLYLKLHFLLNTAVPKNRMALNKRQPLIFACIYSTAWRYLLTSSHHTLLFSSLIYFLHIHPSAKTLISDFLTFPPSYWISPLIPLLDKMCSVSHLSYVLNCAVLDSPH